MDHYYKSNQSVPWPLISRALSPHLPALEAKFVRDEIYATPFWSKRADPAKFTSTNAHELLHGTASRDCLLIATNPAIWTILKPAAAPLRV